MFLQNNMHLVGANLGFGVFFDGILSITMFYMIYTAHPPAIKDGTEIPSPQVFSLMFLMWKSFVNVGFSIAVVDGILAYVTMG